MSEPIKSPAIFLDRDGVINRRRVGDYVKRWSEFEFLDDVFGVVADMHLSGYLIVVVTNQRGIALGVMSEDDLLDIHMQMQNAMRTRTGHVFDAIYFCPHGHDEGCECRKPFPGMLLDAARDLSIDLANSWMIGDSSSDIEAGLSAGCHTMFIGSESASRAELHADSLAGAWNAIKSHQQQNSVLTSE